MTLFRRFFLLLLLCAGSTSWAQYAQVAPVAAFTGAAGAYFYKAAANDAVFGTMIKAGQAGVVNVGGTALKVPAAMRFAANAPQLAARAMYLNPGLAIGIGVAGAIAAYYAYGQFEPVPGGWVKREGGIVCPSNCYKYRLDTSLSWQMTRDAAVSDFLVKLAVDNPYQNFRLNSIVEAGYSFGFGAALIGVAQKSSPSNWSQQIFSFYGSSTPPYDTSTVRPVLPEEFENFAYPPGFPNGMPQALPVPLPVSDPVLFPIGDPILEGSIWPNSAPWTAPLPVPQPVRVPMGDPVPVPNSDPPAWKTPVIDVVPSPAPGDPWRVNMVPKDVTKLDPLVDPAGAPVPATPASGTTAAPGDFKTCGLPGTPACKIDETGTPQPVDDAKYSSKTDAAKAEALAARTTMAGSADKPFFSGWSVLFNAPAVAVCAPIALPGFQGSESMGSINPCPVVDGVRYVMGLLWAVAGLFFSLKMIKEVV